MEAPGHETDVFWHLGDTLRDKVCAHNLLCRHLLTSLFPNVVSTTRGTLRYPHKYDHTYGKSYDVGQPETGLALLDSYTDSF